MEKKQIFRLSIIFLLSLVLGFLFWFTSFLYFFIFVFFYWSLFYILSFPFKKFKNKDLEFFNRENFWRFSYNFLYRISVSFAIILSILASLAYYENEISPAMMPVYHISNWDKKIVFHSMSHIASPEFYLDVKNDIDSLRKNWYILFYEWVRPWTKESNDKFDQALWVKFDKNLYKNMSKLYWLVNQDNSLFVYSWAKNVDLNMDEIVDIYQKLEKKETKKISSNQIKEPIDMNKLIDESVASLSDRQLSIIKYVNRAIMNIIIKNENIQDLMYQAIWNKALMDTILEKRNEYLVKAIESEEEKNIVITYWLLHFKWVFEELQKKDKNWKIEKVNYLQVIR